jgi:hypothetical protein
MDFSNEFNRSDEENSTQIDYEKIYKNEIEDHLYDVNETNTSKDERLEMHETFKYSLIADSGDVIDCPNNNDENLQSSRKSQLTVHPSINSLLKYDQFDDNNRLIEPYPTPENSITINEHQHFNFDNYVHEEEVTEHLLTHIDPSIEPRENFIFNFTLILSPLDKYQVSLFDIECSSTSTNLILPQFIQNHIKSSNSFQQLWSLRMYSPKLIDSNTSKNTLSILWSLIILLSKLIMTGFYFLYSCTKILRYDPILFSFCYLLGTVFGMNAYFLIDFFLILICIISIFVATYEKWLFRSVNLNDYDHELNNTERENRYWKQIKLAAYGLAIGTISTFIV